MPQAWLVALRRIHRNGPPAKGQKGIMARQLAATIIGLAVLAALLSLGALARCTETFFGCERGFSDPHSHA